MKDKPILFSGMMVKQILRGEKTETRREAKMISGLRLDQVEWEEIPGSISKRAVFERHHFKPRFFAGDKLWVRENFIGAKGYDGIPPSKWGNKPVWYCADGIPDRKVWWHLSNTTKPAIHMPRVMSRITCDVVSVELQQLYEMTDADAIAEGIEQLPDGSFGIEGIEWCCDFETPLEAFRRLWIEINKVWDDKFWVEVIRLKTQVINIDGNGQNG